LGPWQWWYDKLTGKPVQMNPSTPHPGFYRQPHKASYGARKTFKPVAYWPGEDGRLNCRIGDEDVSPEKGQDIWESVGNHPVSEEAYRRVAQDGSTWPDEHELVPMGDNLPPEEKDLTLWSLGELTDRIEDLGREALARIEGPPIADQDEADRLANLSDRLTELWKEADRRRKEERKPHDTALKTIQGWWAPFLMKAESYKNLKYKLLTPWQLAEEKRLKQEAEAAAAAGEPAAADARRPRAGTRGRAMTLKTFKRAEITNYAECLEFFSDSPDVKGLVQDLANRAVRAGIAVPGTKLIEEQQTV
jgi:hypothetical protein